MTACLWWICTIVVEAPHGQRVLGSPNGTSCAHANLVSACRHGVSPRFAGSSGPTLGIHLRVAAEAQQRSAVWQRWPAREQAEWVQLVALLAALCAAVCSVRLHAALLCCGCLLRVCCGSLLHVCCCWWCCCCCCCCRVIIRHQLPLRPPMRWHVILCSLCDKLTAHQQPYRCSDRCCTPTSAWVSVDSPRRSAASGFTATRLLATRRHNVPLL